MATDTQFAQLTKELYASKYKARLNAEFAQCMMMIMNMDPKARMVEALENGYAAFDACNGYDFVTFTMVQRDALSSMLKAKCSGLGMRSYDGTVVLNLLSEDKDDRAIIVQSYPPKSPMAIMHTSPL